VSILDPLGSFNIYNNLSYDCISLFKKTITKSLIMIYEKIALNVHVSLIVIIIFVTHCNTMCAVFILNTYCLFGCKKKTQVINSVVVNVVGHLASFVLSGTWFRCLVSCYQVCGSSA
jgi:hypothetical protein